MLINARRDLEERWHDIQLHYSHLLQMEATLQGAATSPIPGATTRLVEISKSTLALLAYNMIEGVARAILDDIARYVSGDGRKWRHFSDQLGDELMRQILEGRSTDSKHVLAKRAVLSADKRQTFSLRTDLILAEAYGNLTFGKLKGCISLIGVDCQVISAAANSGEDLEFFTIRRNKLAHGNVTFGNYLNSHTASELFRKCETVKATLDEVLGLVEAAINNNTLINA